MRQRKFLVKDDEDFKEVYGILTVYNEVDRFGNKINKMNLMKAIRSIKEKLWENIDNDWTIQQVFELLVSDYGIICMYENLPDEFIRV